MQRFIYRIIHNDEEIFMYFNKALGVIELPVLEGTLVEAAASCKTRKELEDAVTGVLTSPAFLYLDGEIGGSPFAGDIIL